MVPPARIELATNPYHGFIMPFNYGGIAIKSILEIATICKEDIY